VISRLPFAKAVYDILVIRILLGLFPRKARAGVTHHDEYE
jgi:hypothetical protein